MNLKKIKQLAIKIEDYQSSIFALKNENSEAKLKIEYLVAPECYSVLSVESKLLNGLILESLKIEVDKMEQELKEELDA